MRDKGHRMDLGDERPACVSQVVHIGGKLSSMGRTHLLLGRAPMAVTALAAVMHCTNTRNSVWSENASMSMRSTSCYIE